MIGNILIVVALLWITLAVAVGFHAKGHNRSGIIWFSVIAVTGIFGLAFYLLAITSANSEKPDDSHTFDDTVVRNAPSAVVGSVVGLVIGILVAGLFVLLFEEIESLVDASLFPMLGLVVGLLLGPVVESRVNIAEYFTSTSVNLSRRRTLGLVGGGATILLAGIAYNYDPQPPKPDPSITETTVQHDSDRGTVDVTMSNPRSEPVTVEIDAWVQVEEVQRTLASQRNTYNTLLSETATVSPDSEKSIELKYQPDDAFRLAEFDLDNGDQPSFSIEETNTP